MTANVRAFIILVCIPVNVLTTVVSTHDIQRN